MKTAIVTGAAGFIGRAITEKPAERGALVSALDRNAGKLADMALQEGVTAVPADLENGVRGSFPGRRTPFFTAPVPGHGFSRTETRLPLQVNGNVKNGLHSGTVPGDDFLDV